MRDDEPADPIGDFNAGFLIADRLGGSVELIPNVIGPARNMPTGARGLFYREMLSAANDGNRASR